MHGTGLSGRVKETESGDSDPGRRKCCDNQCASFIDGISGGYGRWDSILRWVVVDGSAAAFCATAGAIDAGEFFCAHRHQPHRLLPRFGRTLGKDPDKPAWIHNRAGLSGALGEARVNRGFGGLR